MMPKRKLCSYHMYSCNGCGHATIIDKYYKTRRVHCGICGEKLLMDYRGECRVELEPKIGAFSLAKVTQS